MLLRALLAIAMVAACGGGTDPVSADARVVVVPDAPVVADAPRRDASDCVVGDITAPPELQIVYRAPGGTAEPLADGGTLPLTVPPQGGHVVFVGLRVRNVDLCGSSIQAALRHPTTDRVAGFERRPVAWVIAADGFAEPAQPDQISDYANVPLCPNANIDQDIFDVPWDLEVRFYDASDMATQVDLTVTPSCDQAINPAYCRCECAMGFQPPCP